MALGNREGKDDFPSLSSVSPIRAARFLGSVEGRGLWLRADVKGHAAGPRYERTNSDGWQMSDDGKHLANEMPDDKWRTTDGRSGVLPGPGPPRH